MPSQLLNSYAKSSYILMYIVEERYTGRSSQTDVKLFYIFASYVYILCSQTIYIYILTLTDCD